MFPEMGLAKAYDGPCFLPTASGKSFLPNKVCLIDSFKSFSAKRSGLEELLLTLLIYLRWQTIKFDTKNTNFKWEFIVK